MFVHIRRLALPLLLCFVFQSEGFADEVEGFTEPFRTVEISAGEPGVVTRVEVRPGQEVDDGELLLTLDTEVLEATLAVAREKARSEGSLGIAKAEHDLRVERLQQIEQLRGRGHATSRELSRAQADVLIAQARLKLAHEEKRMNELDCSRIEAQIARRKVTSPFSGVISEVHREVGESLLVTDPRIMTLVQLDRLRTRFSVSSGHASNFRPNQRVMVRFQTDNQNQNVPAVVERVSRIADAETETVAVHVIIDNARGELQCGTHCWLAVDQPRSNKLATNKTALK